MFNVTKPGLSSSLLIVFVFSMFIGYGINIINVEVEDCKLKLTIDN